MVRVRIAVLVSATALVTLSLPTQRAFAAPAGNDSPSLHRATYRVVPLANPNQATISTQSATGKTIPLWSGSASYNGVTYPFQMVGKNPFVHKLNPGVMIDAPVIPIIIHFPDGTTSDPTKPTGCGTSTVLSPQQLVAGSPIFVHHRYMDGNILVGKGEYVSAFQRAEFLERDPGIGQRALPRGNQTGPFSSGGQHHRCSDRVLPTRYGPLRPSALRSCLGDQRRGVR